MERALVDGDWSAQATELLRFVGGLRGVDADAYAASEKDVVSECQGVLARAPEDKLEAAFNQLFAVAGAREGGIDAAAPAIARDVAATAESVGGGLRVLNNLFNVVAGGAARVAVFSALVELAARGKMVGVLVPVVSRLAKMVGEWVAGGASPAACGDAVLELRTALDAAQLANEAYAAELAFLEAVGADDARCVDVATAAIVRFANLASVCDVDALAGLGSVQALSAGGRLGVAGALLDTLVASDYLQWKEYAAANQAGLADLGVNAERAGDKMRLLTVASIAATRLGEAVPFGDVAAALNVEDDDVETWVIDVVRSGLMQGKMNQVSRTLVPTRSTYRTFGAAQWEHLAERLAQWGQALDALQPVIRNAKVVAQQQAVQMAGQSRVTIKE
ncbi:hypothetical protein GGF46_003248 [Coemansia sp. RSA 552]|nr:hypothetical protein GGF46_003248 [Coemansia sp. RSA 552]